ncbi:reverse transcriptase [Gossypium australe]|uniref:Reverse transcriptase n=1 Tax=Gossypium australe TaxID=47621 RepID=A0A5B6W7I1_9ROSI|nr:reverse transcriptase [Gossypium australe]
MGTKLHLSTIYHPQIDGQIEVLNRCLEGHLRCMTGEKPSDWVSWIPLAEWWYNTTYHTTIQTTPYKALYGQGPPLHQPYFVGSSRLATVNRSLQVAEAAKHLLKFHLKRAQKPMKQFADKKRSVSELVYLKPQPYRQLANQKLSPRYYGPYPIEAKIGQVAYKLIVPGES